MKRFLMTGLMTLLLVGVFGAPAVFAATQMQDLENALMCKCDDKCGKVLINCTCDTSKKTRKSLMAQLDSGLTVDQIIQTYVDKYGETVLSAPSKTGFNLTAWITPFVALVAGGFGVRKVIQSWADRSGRSKDPGEKSSEPAGDESPSEPLQYSSRLKKELDDLEY